MSTRGAGWFPDPVGRGEHRWWDGHRWTDVVSLGGEERTDPRPPPLGTPAGEATGWYAPTGPADRPTGPAGTGPATGDARPGSTGERPPGAGRSTAWLKAAAVVAVAGIVGVAVGAATGAASDGPDYAAALATDLEARSRGLLTADEAVCVADGMVAQFGEDRLQGLELIGEPDQPWPLADLSDADERTFATLSYDCVEQQHLVDHLVDSWFPVRGRTIDDRRCLSQGYVNALPGTRMREILVALYTDEAYEVDDLLTDEELADVSGIALECGL